MEYLKKNPRGFLVIGMLCLSLGIMWPRFVPFAIHLGPDWSDALRGFLYGVSMALNFLGIRLINRQRHCSTT